MADRLDPDLKAFYESDSRALAILAAKYEQRDKPLFDAFIDLREQIQQRLHENR